jgi:hypothetical protein
LVKLVKIVFDEQVLFAHAILLFAQLVGQEFCSPFCHGLYRLTYSGAIRVPIAIDLMDL